MTPPYRYEPRVLTHSRRNAIEAIVEALKDGASIEDESRIYEALVDLLAAIDIATGGVRTFREVLS